MTTKRLKKLLMAMGLSRNQVNRMVKEQRDTGSKKASNALYYHVFKQDFKLFASACGGEVLPYARHGKTSCYSVVSGYGPMSARPGGAAGLAPAAAGCRRPCGSFGKHLFAERFHLCGGLDGEHDN